LNYLSLYAANDRSDALFGASYSFVHDLAWEFYLSLDAKYTSLDTKINATTARINKRGVKIATSSYASEYDPTVIDMKSISESIYTKDAGYIDIGLAKVFNLSAYFFTFPFSLQREVVYANYRHYLINAFNDELYRITEVKVGASASVVILNSLSLPIGIEYIYNDTFFAKDTNQLFLTLGTSF